MHQTGLQASPTSATMAGTLATAARAGGSDGSTTETENYEEEEEELEVPPEAEPRAAASPPTRQPGGFPARSVTDGGRRHALPTASSVGKGSADDGPNASTVTDSDSGREAERRGQLRRAETAADHSNPVSPDSPAAAIRHPELRAGCGADKSKVGSAEVKDPAGKRRRLVDLSALQPRKAVQGTSNTQSGDATEAPDTKVAAEGKTEPRRFDKVSVPNWLGPLETPRSQQRNLVKQVSDDFDIGSIRDVDKDKPAESLNRHKSTSMVAVKEDTSVAPARLHELFDKLNPLHRDIGRGAHRARSRSRSRDRLQSGLERAANDVYRRQEPEASRSVRLPPTYANDFRPHDDYQRGSKEMIAAGRNDNSDRRRSTPRSDERRSAPRHSSESAHDFPRRGDEGYSRRPLNRDEPRMNDSYTHRLPSRDEGVRGSGYSQHHPRQDKPVMPDGYSHRPLTRDDRHLHDSYTHRLLSQDSRSSDGYARHSFNRHGQLASDKFAHQWSTLESTRATDDPSRHPSSRDEHRSSRSERRAPSYERDPSKTSHGHNELRRSPPRASSAHHQYRDKRDQGFYPGNSHSDSRSRPREHECARSIPRSEGGHRHESSRSAAFEEPSRAEQPPRRDESLSIPKQLPGRLEREVKRFKVTNVFVKKQLAQASDPYTKKFFSNKMSGLGKVKARLLLEFGDQFSQALDEFVVTNRLLNEYESRWAFSGRVREYRRDREWWQDEVRNPTSSSSTPEFLNRRGAELDQLEQQLTDENPRVFHLIMNQWDKKKKAPMWHPKRNYDADADEQPMQKRRRSGEGPPPPAAR